MLVHSLVPHVRLPSANFFVIIGSLLEGGGQERLTMVNSKCPTPSSGLDPPMDSSEKNSINNKAVRCREATHQPTQQVPGRPETGMRDWMSKTVRRVGRHFRGAAGES